MRRLITVALLCLSMATIPISAQADDAVTAKAKYESGVRHFDLSEFEPALADFKEAYRNKPDPAFLYNIAQCHRRLGHTDDAIAFYQSYLRRAPDAKNREEVERRISELDTIRGAGDASIAGSSSGKPLPPPTAVKAPKKPEPENTVPPSTSATQPNTVPTTPSEAHAAATPATSAALDFSSHDQAAQESRSPIYKKWWFWTAVGAVAAGTAAVVTIMAERDPTKIPSSGLGAQRALP